MKSLMENFSFCAVIGLRWVKDSIADNWIHSTDWNESTFVKIVMFLKCFYRDLKNIIY